jgi:hypothetical protein
MDHVLRASNAAPEAVTIRFPHLGLIRWPFPVVPDRDYCTFMADREAVKAELHALLQSLGRRDTSSIHLFWAWFGAGKTHTLLYLGNQADIASHSDRSTAFVTAYSEFPKAARGFLDVFRSFTTNLDLDRVADAYLEVRTCPQADGLHRKLVAASPDLANALQVLAMGDAAKQLTATRWLRAEVLPAAQLRSVGISRRIDSAEESVRILGVLNEILNSAALARGRPGSRLIWILDEFQRIERCAPRIKEEINTGLHSTFNACATGLSLFISFSGNPQKGVPAWFSRELRDRIGRTKTFVLPPMRTDEALKFVADVLSQFRPPGFNNSAPYFPFTKDAVEAIVTEIAKTHEIRPRSVMHAMSAVLEEADQQIERRELSEIDKRFALKALSERVELPEDEES